MSVDHQKSIIRIRLIIGLSLAIIFVGAQTKISAASALPPPSYSAKDIRATVVDEGTRRPLEGVVVVAVWQLQLISGTGPRLQVSEAVTDAQGQFFIPGWGPMARPPLTAFGTSSPRLLFFKHGYVPLALYNDSRKKIERLYPNYRTMPTKQLRNLTNPIGGAPDEPIQESMWDGLTIQLEPFRGTPERWFQHLQFIANDVAREDSKYVKRFFQAVSSERQYLRANPVNPAEVSWTRIETFFLDIDDRLKEGDR